MFYRKSFTDFVVSKDSIKVVEIADIVDHWCQRHQQSIYYRLGIHGNWSSTLNLNFYVTP
jgi:hypothetical protein